MSWWYRNLLRPVLFSLDSERIHNGTLDLLGRVSRHELICRLIATLFSPAELTVQVFGLNFPNPVGLAAGMDKRAAAVPVWSALGFGFSELGGVTWHPQAGNPGPRMFRAVPHQALINRMGFNNPGAEAVALRLAGWRTQGRWPNHPVGVNLGKSKIAPLGEAAQDYARSLRALWFHADFFVINVSSPNTPNLRQLQNRAALDEILAALQEENHRSATAASGSPGPGNNEPLKKPILVKVAPDLRLEALDEILELAAPRQISGIVATNTTVTRPPTDCPRLRRIYSEAGGLSGRPLAALSTQIIRHIHRQTKGGLPVIGVGGVFNAEDAWEKITAGATLVQLYTGLVYEGPGLVGEIVAGLRAKLKSHGFTTLSQAIGSASS